MASITLEIECEVEGNVTPAEPDVGIMGPGVEDADISSVSMLVTYRPGGSAKTVWRNVDLLDGLDTAARQIVIANIFKSFGDEIDEAILSDA